MTSVYLDSELETRVKKASERISENMHIVANEPSLAFYRLQEHVRKALPSMVDKRVEVLQLNRELQGRCYDAEYAVGAVKSMHKAEDNFKNIQQLLKDAIYYKQLLKHQENRRGKKESTSSSRSGSGSGSVMKRLSAHIPLDLPDLPELSDAFRETANRVESMMAQARHSTTNATPEVQAPF